MKIAVAYENGEVFQHFGHTESFKLYEVESGAIVSRTVISTEGKGHGALSELLSSLGVDTLICGGIGGGAKMALDAEGIRIFGGVTGSADAAVEALLAGSLSYNPDVRCNRHGEHHHENGHSCSSHGCGHHHEDGHGCHH